MTPPGATVTAVKDAGRGRVAVELDGVPWRTLPVDAAAAAGLAAGVVLDRPLARRLRAELLRADALAHAVGALRRRDHTRASLGERLARRRVPAAEREKALATLERAGLLDDGRTARNRAVTLAARGAGDLLIRDDLVRRGLAPDVVADALGALDPERERARSLIAARGASLRTARALTAKGFAPESLEGLVADGAGDEIG